MTDLSEPALSLMPKERDRAPDVTHARSEDLLRCALAAGMRTLRQDGIEKVLAGLTTIEDVRATSNV